MADKNERRKQQNREAAQKSYWKKKTEQEQLEKSIAQREGEQIQLHREIRHIQIVLHDLEITRNGIVCIAPHGNPQPPSSATFAAVPAPDLPPPRPQPSQPQPPQPAPLPTFPETICPSQFTGPLLHGAGAEGGVAQAQPGDPSESGGSLFLMQHEAVDVSGPSDVGSVQFQQQLPPSWRIRRGTHDHDHAADLTDANGSLEGFGMSRTENKFPGFVLGAPAEQAVSWERHPACSDTLTLHPKGAPPDHQLRLVNQDGHGSENFLSPTVSQASQGSLNFLPTPSVRQRSVNFLPTPNVSQANLGSLEFMATPISVVSQVSPGSANFLSAPTDGDSANFLPTHAANQASHNSEDVLNHVSHGSANISQSASDCSSIDFLDILEDSDYLMTENEGISTMAAAPLAGRGGETYRPDTTGTLSDRTEPMLLALVQPSSLGPPENSQPH